MRVPLAVVLLAGVALAGCSFLPESECGPARAKVTTFNAANPGDPLQANNGYEWSVSIDGACTKEHAKGLFTAHLDMNAGPGSCQDITGITGAVYTKAGFQPYVMTVDLLGDEDQPTYKGSTSVGLKQAFPEGPGDFLVTARVVYPTTSNMQADLDCILSQLITLDLGGEYKEHK